MTDLPPLLLRLEPGTPGELRLALSEGPAELPSDEVLGALRVRLAEQVGPAARLRESAAPGQRALQIALHDDPSELPSDEQRRVLARRVELRRRSTARPVRARRRTRLALIVACVLVACVAAAASYWVSRHREHSLLLPVAPVSSSGGHVILPEPTVEPAPRNVSAEPTATAEPDAGARSGPARSKALPGAAAEGPTELELLREAHRLQTTDPGAALGVVARHSRLFPAGILAQERELVAVDALMRLGRSEAARVRAAAFLRQYPGSVHALRIQELVGGSAPSSGARGVGSGQAPDGGTRIFSP